MAETKTTSASKTAKTKTTVTKKTVEHTRDALTKASSAQRKELDAKLRALAALRDGGAKSFDATWELVDDIVSSDPPLWRARYSSLREFIAEALPGEDERTVRRNVLVAVAFTPDDEARHGLNLLEQLALYVRERTGGTRTPRAIDLDRLELSVPRPDGTLRRVRARDADLETVRAARGQAGRADSQRASPLEKTLRAALGKHPALAAVTVRVGKGTVAFGGIPQEALGELGRVLIDAGSSARRPAPKKR